MAAEADLGELGISEEILRREWAAQVQAQTRPPPRMCFFFGCQVSLIHLLFKGRAKNKGKQAVEAILVLESTMGSHKKIIRQLEITLAAGDDLDVAELSEQLQDARAHYSRLEQGLGHKRAELCVAERANLAMLQNDAFLRLRMNALALKQRIRDRLRQRKFEIDKLERSYRRSANGLFLHISVFIMLNKY